MCRTNGSVYYTSDEFEGSYGFIALMSLYFGDKKTQKTADAILIAKITVFYVLERNI